VQGFMRTVVVEDLDEVIEASLLLQEVSRGRLGGFFLQGEMHALVTAVLLGMAGLDSFNSNSQPEPPDGELAQVEQGVCGSKGNAVVTADGWRAGRALGKASQIR